MAVGGCRGAAGWRGTTYKAAGTPTAAWAVCVPNLPLILRGDLSSMSSLVTSPVLPPIYSLARVFLAALFSCFKALRPRLPLDLGKRRGFLLLLLA